jgi:predicted PhzF superfamily epimerase YddE/YHI9
MIEISRRATLAGAAASALMPFVKIAPANAAAPLAEKQNASFYRYSVGTHQITVVRDGVATINLPDNYASNASKDDIGKVFAEYHLPTDKVTHSFNPVVINTGPKLALSSASVTASRPCLRFQSPPRRTQRTDFPPVRAEQRQDRTIP